MKVKIFNKNSYWYFTWQRFKKSKFGLFGLSLVLVISVMAMFAPLLAFYGPYDNYALIHGPGIEAPPSAGHPFGTDRFGYDVYSRIFYGARTALTVGVITATLASIIGITIGGLAGYLGGQKDEGLMRFTDSFMLIPAFVVILLLVRIFSLLTSSTFLGDIPYLNMWVIIIVLGVFDWPPIARVARSQFLRIKDSEFVEAAKCLGSSTWRILAYNILSNALPAIVVLSALEVGSAVLSEAMISFLGFGDPKVVSWGQMLTFAATDMKTAPWVAIAPGAFIFLTILGFNVLADALSDAVNPRLKE
jgi:ABC-type dipeptide/oligopeptide/nickel transport system permease subunit